MTVTIVVYEQDGGWIASAIVGNEWAMFRSIHKKRAEDQAKEFAKKEIERQPIMESRG